MAKTTAPETKRVVVLEEDLAKRYREAAFRRSTLTRIQDKAIAQGADITTPAHVKYTERVVQAEVDLSDIWSEIYKVLRVDGWDPTTCTTPSGDLNAGTVSYGPLPLPEAAE